MTDRLEKIGNGSIIHHGKSSDRAYLTKLAKADHAHIIELLNDVALRNGYSKIFCKIPSSVAPLFTAAGYVTEGYIPRFYKGARDAFFVSRFLTENRAKTPCSASMHKLFNLLQSSASANLNTTTQYTIDQLGIQNVDAMAKIYSAVFESYPFPIHDPSYLIETMHQNVQYFGAFRGGQLAAIASCEIDSEAQNAEMTDFATDRQHVGHRLSHHLLLHMEQAMKKQGIKTLYTIARLNSTAMNKTFINSAYSYSGTLVNNTQISGNIESMNLYYKLI